MGLRYKDHGEAKTLDSDIISKAGNTVTQRVDPKHSIERIQHKTQMPETYQHQDYKELFPEISTGDTPWPRDLSSGPLQALSYQVIRPYRIAPSRSQEHMGLEGHHFIVMTE
jgi:hypothetical protein